MRPHGRSATLSTESKEAWSEKRPAPSAERGPVTAARRGTLHAMDDRDDVELHIVKVPMLDTGIGRFMGYADDAEFVAAAEAEREAALRLLTPRGAREARGGRAGRRSPLHRAVGAPGRSGGCVRPGCIILPVPAIGSPIGSAARDLELRAPSPASRPTGQGRRCPTVPKPAVHIQTILNPFCYGRAQLQRALRIADRIGRGGFILCEPPERVA